MQFVRPKVGLVKFWTRRRDKGAGEARSLIAVEAKLQ